MDLSIFQLILQTRRITYLVTDRHLQVIQCDGLTDILDRQPMHILGYSLTDIIPELNGCDAILSDILEDRLPCFHLTCINREMSGGQTMYLTMESLPHRNQAGAITGILHVIEDVTELGTVEQRLAQQRNDLAHMNEQLVRANRAKDEFLANMSHELRTPLTVILGWTELLQINECGSVDQEQLAALQRIHESGQHLLALINDVLDIVKIEAGKLDLERVPVAIEHTCQFSLAMVQHLARQKQLRSSLDIAPEISTLQIDEHRVQQILVNLLNNAVKFTPEEGAFGIEVRGDTAKQVASITVWDTGVGIAQQDLHRIFEPFVQLDSQLSRRYDGTGLGLALARRLTELHGGHLIVESTPGSGSRFTVNLPWNMSTANDRYLPFARNDAIRSNACLHTSHQNALILLAEDHEDSAHMLAQFLHKRGFRILFARNGEEALVIAHEYAPDIILMDIQMPDMDGLEAIRQMRNHPQVAAIPIIAVTAMAMQGDRHRCLQAGANDYLSKPVHFDDLILSIDAQLRQNQFGSHAISLG